ncbi:MAG: hypothetical protein Q9208_006630 [Pyrenodesmia sp. 3 TL-2023]
MLTLHPDIELQSLDRLLSSGLPSNPQSPLDLGRGHGRPTENLEERSALVVMTITMIDHEEIPVVSKSATRTGLARIGGRHTRHTTSTVRMDQIHDSATTIGTIIPGARGTEPEVDLRTRSLLNSVGVAARKKMGMADDTDAACRTKAEEGTKRVSMGFLMNSQNAGEIDSKKMTNVQSSEQPPVDEATLIEERRKRREAIKAKHRGQATPLLVQALALDRKSAPNSPKPPDDDQKPVTDSEPLRVADAIAHVDQEPSATTHDSPPLTPKEIAGQDSPTALVVLSDIELANRSVTADGTAQEDEPSAADYDPTMDMQEDRARQDTRQLDEIPSGAYDETAATHQDVLLPEPKVQEPLSEKSKEELDMFADEDDMFAEAPVASTAHPETAKAVPIPQSKGVDMSMLDDWDDDEGYYKVILGELLDNRYHVQSNLGRGMFSGVVRVTDQKARKLAAIKIIRNNESMKKAGLKEVEILQKLAQADPEDKKHVIKLERIFEHKGHLCMVFENLSINLREVLKKFGRDVGINLKAVRAYAQQMFLGLTLLRKCNVLHADLKPDNVLINESRNVLKICDLGSASDASENEITPYLVSRFYRAPEIILGVPYDFGIDVWSVGCTLFELYTGKILFTGRSNNQMLRAIMECRGKFSHKILRKAEFGRQHFDDLLNFRSVEKDKLTAKDVVRIINFTKPTRDLRSRVMANAQGMSEVEIKELYLFIDLLDRCLNLNPEKRCTPNEALKHPFITRAKI